VNRYKAFYRDKTIEVYAATSYDALQKATTIFKVSPAAGHTLVVVLRDLAGTPVVHVPEE
jgi:hypothetical protein